MEAVTEKKKLRIQKYPDARGRGLTRQMTKVCDCVCMW